MQGHLPVAIARVRGLEALGADELIQDNVVPR
jgi:hypothetical protein